MQQDHVTPIKKAAHPGVVFLPFYFCKLRLSIRGTAPKSPQALGVASLPYPTAISLGLT